MATVSIRRSTTILLLLLGAVLAVTTAFPRESFANHVECSDGVDNDNDGTADYPQDSGCSSTEDDSEADGSSASSVASSSMVLTLTDGRTSVRAGDSVIYVLTAKQSAAGSKTVTVELELPTEAEQISPDKGGSVNGTRVRWNNVVLAQNQTATFTIQTTFKNTAQPGATMTAKATSEAVSATDITIIQGGSSSQQTGASAYAIAITDNHTYARPGEELTYVVSIQNTSAVSQTSDVILTASHLTDVTEVVPSANNASNVIVWNDVHFNPGQQLTFSVKGTLQRHITDYVSLKTDATVGGVSASDITTVLRNQASSATQSSSSRMTESSSAGIDQNFYILFSKSPDAQEAVAGSVIRYTLFVQNVLLNTIDDAFVTDRFDPAILEIVDAGGATIISESELRWSVPRLGPGEIWQQEYALRVLPSVPGNTQVQNIASIGGSDVEYATLSERVMVVSTGIVDDLPATGAAYDVLFALLTIVPAAGATIVQRKRTF